MKKRLTALLVSAAVLLALLVVAVGFYQTTPEESTPPASAAPVQSPTPTPTPQPTPAVTVLRFSATGDNLIHNGIYNRCAAPRTREKTAMIFRSVTIRCAIFMPGATSTGSTRKPW